MFWPLYPNKARACLFSCPQKEKRLGLWALVSSCLGRFLFRPRALWEKAPYSVESSSLQHCQSPQDEQCGWNLSQTHCHWTWLAPQRLYPMLHRWGVLEAFLVSVHVSVKANVSSTLLLVLHDTVAASPGDAAKEDGDCVTTMSPLDLGTVNTHNQL
jgi:hypothetical protein